ncbi:MAG: DAK2 domain-containing protein [Anaerolineales bacterium]|nr:DAK2 domain-containing protein [Anaerolineales bacterium]
MRAITRASNSNLSLPGFEVNHQAVLAGNGLGLKAMLRAGGQWLEAHRQVVNSLNVFPVPDGDTGTNMVLTMRSALAEAETTGDNRVETVAAAIAHGALMGARGNSGVILSQFLQGLALSFAGQENFTGEDLARAARQGTKTAYQSVVNPVEGTILTVAREVAEAAQQSIGATRDLTVLLADMVAAAKAAEANTPELLPILKEAGVTDSGGQGLVYILEGSLRFLQGEPVETDPASSAALLLPPTLTTEEMAYGYDVQFLIQGERLNVEEIRAQVDRLGWSTLVVGNERTVKVHVHTQDPGVPLSYGASQGILLDVVVENMEVQAKKFVQERGGGTHVPPLSLPSQLTDRLRDSMTTIGTVCVAPSHGLAHILQSLGANQIVLGGQTMNPSPQELLDAVAKIHGPDVLILPNNGNVVLAAQQAQKLADKNVRVVPTKTIPQGIAALLSLNYQADLEANAERMLSAARQVQTVEITRAVRDTSLSGFHIKLGDVMGLLNDELVSVGQDDDEVTLDVLAKVEAGTHEIITIYFGQECLAARAGTLAEKIRALYPELEVEVHDGGQPYYHYIISLE